MRDPLTDKQKKEFLSRFKRHFYEKYEKALKCGALDDFEDGDQTIARCVLIITAEDFKPYPISVKRP
ncbi:MAG: hypothetical protein H3Z50_06455 [archaeon]|nr:hypothetical protein [archaeon]MCP8306559.1 hypothetical protein [archaeon]